MPVMMILVVIMLVMIVMIVMRAVTVRMVVTCVMHIGAVRMAMTATGIGAAFGVEGCLDLDDARTQTLHHRLNHMIASDAQAFCHDLRRQVTVAEVPGNPDQMVRIGSPDFR